MSAIQINRSAALGVFIHCGWSTAARWDSAKMASKLQDVPSVVPDAAPTDEAVAASLEQVLTGVREGNTFEIVDDVPVEEPKPKKEKEPKAPKAPKAPKEPKPKKEKAPKEARVTWLSAAAQVAKKHAFPETITKEMIDEVNVVRGAENNSLAANHLRIVIDVVKFIS